MLEDIQAIQDEVGTLINWILEMQNLLQNPYSSGLNVQRVLNDLTGYAKGLTKMVYDLEQKIKIAEGVEEETEKADSATVEQ